MEKWIMNVGMAIFAGAAMVLSAISLPIMAAADFKNLNNKVMTVETPVEYAEEFADTAVINDSGFIQPVYITDSQLAPLVSEAERAFQENFEISVPVNATMGYYAHVDEEYGLVVSIDWANWMEEYTPDVEEVRYSAYFSNMDLEKSTAKLLYISATNGFDRGKVADYVSAATKGFKNNLDMSIPENYTLTKVTLFKHFLPEYARTVVNLLWQDTAKEAKRMNTDWQKPYLIMTEYQAGFDKVDLENQTGRLTQLFKNDWWANVLDGYDDLTRPPVVSDAQKDALLESAKSFAARMGINVGEVRYSQPMTLGGTGAMDFIFDSPGMNNSTETDVSIYITIDGRVVGYLY